MKTLIYVSLLAATLAMGCGDNNSAKPAGSTNTPAASTSPLSAPADYVSGLAGAQARAIKTVDVASLNQAVQMFYVQENRFPKDLNELVQKQLIARVPDAPRGMKIVYDATTGTVKVVNAE